MKKLVSLSLCLFASAAVAHEGHDHDHADEAAAKQKYPSALVLPAIDGPKPWSDKPHLNDPDRFQIAIMTDHTGGHRPGVWMDAVRKLNLLRPEFVMSVGDLIEGYTEDPKRIDAMWEEFLGFIDEMEMRFFFVAGNHDVTNPTLHQRWREQFGREWYSFDYRGVHFLALCSEDPGPEHISDEQLEFVKTDLAEHADARWTLVFLHKPLWTYAERAIANGDADPTNWKKVEAMLVDRPHTVFAGHVHHYAQYQRNERQYYALATTGGGSLLRGNEYGEFDHVMWLTMEPDGPHVVNLRLDGILPPDVVTEESAKRFGAFLRQVRVEVEPILIDDHAGFSEGELTVKLDNEFAEAVEMTGRIDGLPLRGLTVEPDGLKIGADKKSSSEQRVRIRFDEPIAFESLQRGTFTAIVRSKPTGAAAPLSAERVIPVIIDRRHLCPFYDGDLKLDGQVEAWPEPAYTTPERPLLIGQIQDWTGPADGSFAFTVTRDKGRLIFSAKVTDEKLVAGKDRIEWLLDARPDSQRMADPRQRGGTYRFSVAAPEEGGEATVRAFENSGSRRQMNGVEGAARRVDGGYEVELTVPQSVLIRHQGGQHWREFQLAAIQSDVDDPDRPATEIVWRGTADARERNANYARFERVD